MAPPTLDALQAWPGLDGLLLEDGAPLHHERGIWGKAHQVTSDFRWLARSPGLQAQVDEFTIGPVDAPGNTWFWRGARGRHLAMSTYPTPARDHAQRHNAVEQQVCLAAPRAGLPPAAACALLMHMLDGHRHKDWWAQRRDPRWAKDPGFHLSLDELDVIEPSANRIAQILQAGLDDLKRSLPLSRLAEALRRWVVEGQGAVLDGLREPLGWQATAALLLTVPPAPPGEGLSVAGWVFSSRTQLETLSPLWELILCEAPPLGATPVGDAPAEWTRALEQALAGDLEPWRALARARAPRAREDLPEPIGDLPEPLLPEDAYEVLHLDPIDHALELLRGGQERRFDRALLRALEAQDGVEGWNGYVIEALGNHPEHLVEDNQGRLFLAHWVLRWVSGPGDPEDPTHRSPLDEKTWCEAIAMMLVPDSKLARVEELPKLLCEPPPGVPPAVMDICALAASARKGSNAMWLAVKSFRSSPTRPTWELLESDHHSQLLAALATWVRLMKGGESAEDVSCNALLHAALQAMSCSELVQEAIDASRPGVVSQLKAPNFVAYLRPEARRRREELLRRQAAPEEPLVEVVEAPEELLPYDAPDDAEGAPSHDNIAHVLRNQRPLEEGFKLASQGPLEQLLALIERLPDDEDQLHALFDTLQNTHPPPPELLRRLRRLILVLESIVRTTE